MGRTLLLFGFLFWEDIHERARNNLAGEILDLFGLEFYETRGQGKEGIVFSLLDVLAGVKFGPTLADDDVADRNRLVSENLDAEALGNRVTAEGG